MLFSAVSSRCFSDSSRCCASRFCRLICRMIRNSISAITRRPKRRGDDQEPGLRAPVGKRVGDRGGGDDHDRKVARVSAASAEPVLAVDRAFDPQRLPAAMGQDLVQHRRILEFLSDHRVDMRIARQHRPVAMEHGDRRAFPEGERSEEFLVIDRVDASRHHAEKDSVPARSTGGRSRSSSCRRYSSAPAQPVSAPIAAPI